MAKEYESFEVVTQAMEKFDRNCPATKVFKSYFNVTCRSLRCAITDEQYYEAEKLITELAKISEKYEIDIVISLTAAKDSLPDSLKEFVTVSL